MKKDWQRWSFVVIAFLGILSGSRLLTVYEEKLPSPKVRKTIKIAHLKASIKKAEKKAERDTIALKRKQLANALIQAGLQKIGVPYVFGGNSEKGFDCSGFVYHIFEKFNIHVPRSSKLLASAGKPVEPAKARRGDILIFRGTNPSDHSPGHVGIVISKPGEPLQFVHASSNGGVKVSTVPGTKYERRFLEARRVLL